MPLLVTIEQAACNALARWLASQLPAEVVVSDRWPDPDAKLPRQAVTVLRAGPAKEEHTQPEVDSTEDIHAGVSARIAAPTVTNLASAITALNAACASYEAHRVSLVAHASADATNALTAPLATNLATAIARANDLRVVAAPHLVAPAHAHPDGARVLAALPLLEAGDEAGLLARVPVLVNALEAHYAARIYVWRVADVEQPVQIEVWTTSDAARDDLMARLVPLLHAGEGESAGIEGIDCDPVRDGTFLALADGWTGYADAEFDAPAVDDTAESVKRSEYRATYRGTLAVWRLVRAQSPRITRAELQSRSSAPTTKTSTVSLNPDGTTSTSYA